MPIGFSEGSTENGLTPVEVIVGSDTRSSRCARQTTSPADGPSQAHGNSEPIALRPPRVLRARVRMAPAHRLSGDRQRRSGFNRRARIRMQVDEQRRIALPASAWNMGVPF